MFSLGRPFTLAMMSAPSTSSDAPGTHGARGVAVAAIVLLWSLPCRAVPCRAVPLAATVVRAVGCHCRAWLPLAAAGVRWRPLPAWRRATGVRAVPLACVAWLQLAGVAWRGVA